MRWQSKKISGPLSFHPILSYHVQPISFSLVDGVPDGIATAYLQYKDSSTGRTFVVRQILGPMPHERLLGLHVPDESVRFFLHEVIPNGRLAQYQLDEMVDILETNPKVWEPAKSIPSQALPLIRQMADKHPGFDVLVDEGKYSPRMTFLGSLDACAMAVQNALDADVWLCSEEPTKRHVLGPRTQIDFRAKVLLDALPNKAALVRTIQSLGQRLSEHEQLVISTLFLSLVFRVTDMSLQYPRCVRFVAVLDKDGTPVAKGFTRGGWGRVAISLLGVRLDDFDGPAGRSNGQYPLYGQTVSYPGVRPASVTHCSLALKSHGEFNRIFGYCVVNGVGYWVRGKRIAGEFEATRLPAVHVGEEFVVGRIRRDHEALEPHEVPHFWERLMSAIESARDFAPTEAAATRS